MALVTTPGAANADSYATVAEADAYNAARGHTEAWSDADNDTKEASLREATRLLDACFNWTGVATDGVQVLTWPRTGMLTRNGYAIASSVIPQELKNAESELARQVIEANRTADSDVEKQGLTSLSAGSVSLGWRDKYQKLTAEQELLIHGSDFAYLSQFIPDLVRALLVPSWYEQPSFADASKTGFMFEAM